MPVLYRKDGFTFYIYPSDCGERKHVHVEKGGGSGKIWLDTGVWFEGEDSFKTQERRSIDEIVKDNRDGLIAAYDKFCKTFTPVGRARP